MAEFIHDDKVWYQAYLDTPFDRPGGRTAEEAAMKPGNAVKSIETERENGGFPKYFGRLVEYGDNCLVRGYGDLPGTKFIWKGTSLEYHQTWVVD